MRHSPTIFCFVMQHECIHPDPLEECDFKRILTCHKCKKKIPIKAYYYVCTKCYYLRCGKCFARRIEKRLVSFRYVSALYDDACLHTYLVFLSGYPAALTQTILRQELPFCDIFDITDNKHSKEAKKNNVLNICEFVTQRKQKK